MALSRNIQISFWKDSKIMDDFTPEDRYFYLYLMTNPNTNLCGCYEISMKQMSDELGYSKETVEKLISRMAEQHKVICYSKTKKEVLLLNWHKYNWTESSKLRYALEKEIEQVKDGAFKTYLIELLNNSDTLSIPYPYGMDTVSIPYPYGMDTRVYTNTLNTNTQNSNTLNTNTLNANTHNTNTNNTNTQNTNSENEVLDKSARAKKNSKTLSKDECFKKIDEMGFQPDLEEAVKNWILYKMERNEGYKEVGLNSLLKQIDEKQKAIGCSSVVDVILLSMSNMWKGIIWEKARSGTTHANSNGVYGDPSADREAFLNYWRNV